MILPRRAVHALRATAVATSLALLAVAPARADEDADPEGLFDQAHKLMEDRATLDQACLLFAQSLKLAERGDTLLNLAECHRRQGKTATAWAEFDKAIPIGEKVRFTQAIQIAKKLRDDLAAKLSTLTIAVPPETAALEGFAVIVNGKVWPKEKWNQPTIFDPGPIELRASAKGFKPFLGHVDLGAEKDVKTLSVALEREPPPPAPAPPPPPPPKPKPLPIAKQKPVWPWIVGGAGVALGGAAVGFAIDQRSASKSLNDNCGANRKACVPGYDFASERSRELRDFGLFVGLGAAGLVAIGVGAVELGILSRGSPTARTSLQPAALNSFGSGTDMRSEGRFAPSSVSVQVGPGSIGLRGDF